MSRWLDETGGTRGASYDQAFRDLAEAGVGDVEGLGDDLGPADDGHEVGVAAPARDDVLVQVGSRVGRTEPTWAAPIWWGGNFGYYRHGPWIGPRWGLNFQYDALRYDREVAVLIRDRSSGKPIFEARASNEGSVSSASSSTLTAMFEAAMLDFPRLGMNPRRVSVPLTAP